jgi:hypothetical protein|tara:strand:+ start:358 stop:483 length:126 start_codon:yes stop_codon:yes gene_type:complete
VKSKKQLRTAKFASPIRVTVGAEHIKDIERSAAAVAAFVFH